MKMGSGFFPFFLVNVAIVIQQLSFVPTCVHGAEQKLEVDKVKIKYSGEEHEFDLDDPEMTVADLKEKIGAQLRIEDPKENLRLVCVGKILDNQSMLSLYNEDLKKQGVIIHCLYRLTILEEVMDYRTYCCASAKT